MTIELKQGEAVFSQQWLIETKSLVPLPGSANLWPESVKDNTTPIVVLEHNGTPSVFLKPGRHIISGKLIWEQLPDAITLPPATGLISLKSNIQQTDRPFIDKQGKLWLKRRDNKTIKEMDQASVQVFRKIQDTIPLQEDLHIILTVSGAPREIILGLKIKHDFLPLRITSPLPVRFDHQGRIVIQARPGQWFLDVFLRNTSSKSPDQLSIGTIDGLWPKNEIWSFEAFPKLRRVHIENVRSIDPSRTGLPANWLNLPAYFMGRDDTMQLVEKERGNYETTPNRLTLNRTLWLDQTGTGLTVHDAISGTMTKGWRLNVVGQQHLGKVEIDGKSQLITRLPGSDQIGVEVRKGKISLTADSRLEQPVRMLSLTFSALGWNNPFQRLSATLNLPPGWKLLSSTGVDKVPTWITRWSLLDIFLVLIICLATGKLFGRRWGLLALAALVLFFHQPEAPRYLWLPLLALLAVGNKLTSEKVKIFVKIPLGILILLLVLQSIPFMVREVRVGIFPQLEFGPYFRLATTTNQNVSDAVSAPMGRRGELKKPFSSSKAAKMYTLQRMSLLEKSAASRQADKGLQYSPQAMIQTGPGLPLWHWRTLRLTWNGPVNPGHKVGLILLPPWLNCLLAFIRVGLLGLLLMGFLSRSFTFLRPQDTSNYLSLKKFLPVFFLVLLITGGPVSVKAQIPDQDMLRELQNRLLSPPACGNECASLNNCLFQTKNGKLLLRLTVHAATETAVPLPGDRHSFSTILVDNKPAEGLRMEGSTLLIKLSAGIHHIILEKELRDLHDFSLTFPLLPHRAQAQVSGWTVTGIHPNQTMDKQISFTKITQEEVNPDNRNPELSGNELILPPFFQVIRTLHFGLKWTVDTRIIRKTQGNVIRGEIPLIPGEMPTTSHLYISENKVQINLGPHDKTFSWHSVLPQRKSLTLTAAKTTNWIEVWYLDISPIWHIAFTGIPEVSQTNPAGLRFPEYHPYPGESLTMSISRPSGVPGPTMTIDSSHLQVHPGARSTDCTLRLRLHASRGMEHTITLPQNTEVLKVMINNKEYQIQLNAGRLTLPIQPGNEKIDISWRSNKGIQTRTITPLVDLSIPSVNSTIHMAVPLSRWILFTGGPRIGPAVLFWGEILIIVFLAFLLGRTRLAPISTIQWLLLGIGLSQISIIYGALVVGWLFLLALRKERGSALSSHFGFNLLQISLIVLTILACYSLLYAVQKGLLGYPDMQIGGNGSYGHSLTWYQDRNSTVLPRAWVISFPMFVYRGLMLAWALWLAYSLLKWLNWGWACFTTGEIWRKKIQQPNGEEQNREDDNNTSQPAHSLTEGIQTIDGEEPIPHPEKPESRKKSWLHLFSFKLRKKREPDENA